MQRRRAAVLIVGFAAILAAASVATPQDSVQPHYWPRRNFDIPVNVDRINQAETKPSHLQLYSSLNRGKWQAETKLPVSGLQDIGDGKKGFRFTADRDGEFEFSVQLWYPSGESSPKRVEDLTSMLAVSIDTAPPDVRVAASSNGVRWTATDDYLDPNSIKVEARLPTSTKWQDVTNRTFKAVDNFTWKMAPGQVIEVRVSAKDRAGNEGFSPIVRVPGNDAIGTSFPKGNPIGSDWPPSSPLPRDPLGPSGIGALPKPRIEYVSGMDITVDYTIQKAGRSGVRAANLYVQKDSSAWAFKERFPIDPPADTGKTLSLKYTADKQGLYGFFVAPESGAGVKADPPRRDDQPMLYVVVDTEKPFVKITAVRVTPGGVHGPLVEIAWECNDQNMLPNPVSLEYSVDKDAVQWKEIKYRLPAGSERPDSLGQKRYVNSYSWEVPETSLWKFYVRIRAVDQAGNTGNDQWKEEVIVDLDKPAAGITGVRGGGATGGSGPSNAPANPMSPMSPTKLPDRGSPLIGIPSGTKLPEIPK
ncbi:MAG TPA: hypothetical protein VGL71_09225 [Urbifossiella sp.]